MKIIKLPKNPLVKFKPTAKVSVWAKFYSWLRSELGVNDKYPLNVSDIYSSKEFEKILYELAFDGIKREHSYLSKKKIETGASLEVLNYSPSTRLNVPVNEIWIDLKEVKDGFETDNRSITSKEI